MSESICHKCGCTASEDNWIVGFDPEKMTCERCHGLRRPLDNAPAMQILEPNVSKNISCIRVGLDKPIYCMLNGMGGYFTPTIQELSNTELKDILDHRIHMSRTNFADNARCSYEWEDQDNNRLLTFDVYAYMSKFVPAQTYGPPEDCYPAEGGEMEDYYVVLTDAELYDNDGNTVKKLDQLTWKQVMSLELEFESEIEKHGSIYDSLYEKLFDDVASAAEDYDDDYDDYD